MYNEVNVDVSESRAVDHEPAVEDRGAAEGVAAALHRNFEAVLARKLHGLFQKY